MGEKQKMCLVRFLNNTVMVRVGGGWVTLAEFLENNDPCKGKAHFSSSYIAFHCKTRHHISSGGQHCKIFQHYQQKL